MAVYYNSIGSSIYNELQKLYSQYGYYLEGIKSVTLKGKDGIEKMAILMADLRENVKDTLIKVAEIYKEDPEKVAELTAISALKVFGILK